MSTVLYSQTDGIAVLTLNRPARLNALDAAMVADLGQAVAQAVSDPAARVILLRGAGDHFMAGGDLKWFQTQLTGSETEKEARFAAIVGAANDAVLALQRSGKPVLAVVQGAVAGFGLSLLLAADLALAAEGSYFTMAYSAIGTTPDGGASFTLPRQVGQKQAMEIALLGGRFSAAEAERIGLVNRVLPADQLEDAVADWCRRLVAGSVPALARTKALLRDSASATLESQMQAEQAAFAACAAGSDFAEGLDAFLNRRRPAFG